MPDYVGALGILATGTQFAFLCDVGDGGLHAVKIDEDFGAGKILADKTLQVLSINNVNDCVTADRIFGLYQAGLWKI